VVRSLEAGVLVLSAVSGPKAMRHSIASPAIQLPTTSASREGPTANHRPVIEALNATKNPTATTLPRTNRRVILKIRIGPRLLSRH